MIVNLLNTLNHILKPQTRFFFFFFLAFPPNFVSYHLFHIEVSWSHFVRCY